ncbi:hypothetical protein PMKS-001318 [Pichia membranifaciens]|uniref:Uncharacterized protein n=1 Tax=Pichia membranifaciens TaxID=4926 RepID=A0A1Q2YE78_9ASCO|nr:hypothetical protein PMKS-001318 [Pichia membranifaciens]
MLLKSNFLNLSILRKRIWSSGFLKKSISSLPTANTKHVKKISTPKGKPRPKKELTYEQKSEHYLLKELKKEDTKYKARNQQISKIVQQFADILNLYGLRIVSAPLPGYTTLPFDYIHLSKKINQHSIDLLLDSRCTSVNDAQVVVTDETNQSQVLYLMGSFARERGFVFYSAMIIDTEKIGKSTSEVCHAICSAEGWIFQALNNFYEKRLDIDNSEVAQFLTFQHDESNIPDLTGAMLIDALLHYTIADLINNKPEESADLNSILYMLVSYCHDSVYGNWIHDFKSFIQS